MFVVVVVVVVVAIVVVAVIVNVTVVVVMVYFSLFVHTRVSFFCIYLMFTTAVFAHLTLTHTHACALPHTHTHTLNCSGPYSGTATSSPRAPSLTICRRWWSTTFDTQPFFLVISQTVQSTTASSFSLRFPSSRSNSTRELRGVTWAFSTDGGHVAVRA